MIEFTNDRNFACSLKYLYVLYSFLSLYTGREPLYLVEDPRYIFLFTKSIMGAIEYGFSIEYFTIENVACF